MRRKVVVNSVINPLTAIMNCRNGDIFTSPDAIGIMRRVCQEAAAAFSAQAQEEAKQILKDTDHENDDAAELTSDRLPRALSSGYLEQECLRVADLTKGNISSMLADIRRGVPTEIGYMNEYLLRLGQAHGIRMPTTLLLAQLVKMRSTIPLDQMLGKL
jgi:2-dehydropantoate 2-reductase